MSILNHEYKHVFIHVPRTSGTSMESQPFVGGNGHRTMSSYLAETPDNYFKWAFVRHPCDRLVSAYSGFLLQCPVWYKDAMRKSFSEWVNWLCDGKENQRRIPHTVCQTEYLMEGNHCLMDFVGRFEKRIIHWEFVCRVLGITEVPTVHKNRTDHKPWQTMFTEDMRNRVRKAYAEDFDIFGYEC